MDKVRFGIVGMGNMGSAHATVMKNASNAVLAAICDGDKARLEKNKQQFSVPGFDTHTQMMDSKLIDAVLVAVPHYLHTAVAKDAFDRGLHVLCEKPIAVTVRDGRELNETYKKYEGKLKFGINFQSRTNPLYRKMRELIADGELGEVSRITWICTDWFRSNAYYASGGWRGTWSGEGGGVLINQCPHSLDLLQWIPGLMPSRVTAVAFIGKTHPIEVEDEVSAILEYPNGAIGQFATSTSEAPGTNRMEIAGDKGKLVVENGKLTFSRNRQGVREFNTTTNLIFGNPECWQVEVPVKPAPAAPGHQLMIENFANAVLKDEPLNCPGQEGVKSLEIGNAMLMSGLTRKPVDLPMDGPAYDRFIETLAKEYGGRKTVTGPAKVQQNMAASFRG